VLIRYLGIGFFWGSLILLVHDHGYFRGWLNKIANWENVRIKSFQNL
jgi:hypothetical protein